jgi:septum formation topological specificity factor MinE
MEGTTSSTASSPTPSPPPNYISVQERKRMNQQAIINVIFSFSIVLLACQTFKSGIEKRRIQQQYNATKETLQQTQATIQQYIFPTDRNSTIDSDEKNQLSPEILHIAQLILQHQQQKLVAQDHDRDQNETSAKSRSWFLYSRGKSLPLESEVAQLLETKETSNSRSLDDDTTPQLQKDIAHVIQKRLQLLLCDIAFDDVQKESLHVQALAASSSSQSTSTTMRTTPTSIRSVQHGTNAAAAENDQTDDSMSLIESVLLESLQLESDVATTSYATTTRNSNTATNTASDSIVDYADTTSASDASESNKVVKKRLFSI